MKEMIMKMMIIMILDKKEMMLIDDHDFGRKEIII